MRIYSGKFTHVDGYAKNELYTITFPGDIKVGNDAIVILQWTQNASGEKKANSEVRGKITKVDTMTNGPTKIEIFKGTSEYYWYNGIISPGYDRIDLEMRNPKNEYCGPIKTKVVYKD